MKDLKRLLVVGSCAILALLSSPLGGVAADPPSTSWSSGVNRLGRIKGMNYIRGDAKDAGTAQTVAMAHLPKGARVVETVIESYSSSGGKNYQVFLYYEK